MKTFLSILLVSVALVCLGQNFSKTPAFIGASRSTSTKAFSPLDIPNCIVAYEPRVSALNSTGPDVQATDGQLVVKMEDLSGNYNHALQDTNANMEPMFKAGSMASSTTNIDTLRFYTQTNRMYLTNYPIGTGAFTIAYRIKFGASMASQARLLDAVNQILVCSIANFTLTRNAGTTAAIAGTTFKTTEFYSMVVTATGNNPSLVNFYTNGAAVGTADQSSGNPAACTYALLGDREAGGRGADVEFAYLYIYSRVLNTNEIADFNNYMR